MPEAAVETRGLRKSYGLVEALRGLDLRITTASLHGFLGRFDDSGRNDSLHRAFPGWRKDLEEHYRRTFNLNSDRRVKELSRRARTKLVLLLTLCRGAELLMLDEPTSGLDPAAAEEVLQALVSYAAGDGTTVFFSSHQIAEVEQISDRVTIIDRGRALVTGTLDDLRVQYRRIQLVFANEVPREPCKLPA
jgi:ABC-type multidrug transport system ATPase subunit